MKRFAIVPIIGGIVSNVVVGESIESVTAIVGECVEETEATGPVSVGYEWNGSVFIAPLVAESDTVEPEVTG